MILMSDDFGREYVRDYSRERGWCKVEVTAASGIANTYSVAMPARSFKTMLERRMGLAAPSVLINDCETDVTTLVNLQNVFSVAVSDWDGPNHR